MNLPAPTAQGVFVKTPFPHLLVYALERGLTGTFELAVGEQPVATITVIQGFPAKVRTAAPVFFLGELMLELQMITPDHLHGSLARMQETPRLQGQILAEMGVDPNAIEAGLRAQVERKVEHLFGLPPETTFAYYDNLDILQRYGGPPTPIDPFPVLWRGVREAAPWEHVDATLRRLGNAGVRLGPSAVVERFQFQPNEWQAVELLRQRPLRVVDLAGTKLTTPTIAQLLVYFLMITKQVELVEQSAVGPASGQAFARVQLAARPVARAPMIVEEVAASPANDERVSSPGTAAPVTGPSPFVNTPSEPITPIEVPANAPINVSPMDIASLITETIASSLPPPVTTVAVEPIPQAPMVPAFGSGGSGSMQAVMPVAIPTPQSVNIPAAPLSAPPSSQNPPASQRPPPSQRPLTAEQNALKTKILERADAISGQNFFQMLGVDQDAPLEAIQKAFFALAKVWHPDRLPGALADVKDACSKVFTHLTEAHATLIDGQRRAEYMKLLREGGATPDDQAKIQAVIEAATEFQKAEFLMKRNPQDPQVFELVKRSLALDPETVDYLALFTWLEAQKPEFLSREKTIEKISVLDRCVAKSPNGERAYFFRGMLYKRIDEASKAVKDFRRASEINPRNLDAAREVRLHMMRGGTKPPPGMAPDGSGRPQKSAGQDTLRNVFGKLFKK